MFTSENAAIHGSKGGHQTVKRHGRRHMSKIGRKGFEETTRKHFGGCEESHKRWLAQKGLWEYWVMTGVPMRYDRDGKPIYRNVDHPSQRVPF